MRDFTISHNNLGLMEMYRPPIPEASRFDSTNSIRRLQNINAPERIRLLCFESFVIVFTPRVWGRLKSENHKETHFEMSVEEVLIQRG